MKKRIKVILLILILILLVLIINSTYSKYAIESQAIVSRKIAGWIIKINDTDITAIKDENSGSTNPDGVTFNITGDDVKWEQDSHVTEGNIIPGIKGYFYLRIDPTQTQTALKYTIDIDISNILKDNVNFKINNISEINNNKELHIINQKGLAKVQRIKLLDEIKSEDDLKRIDIIKVDLEWVNDEKYDRFDTAVGETVDKKFIIPVKVHAIQYTGENYDF